MKITNIANNRDKQGYFYSSEHYHPTTHHLAVEPWLAGYCLKLDSEIEIPSHCYFSEKDYMDALKANRIIDFEIPSRPQKEVVIEQKAAEEKLTEKTIELGEIQEAPQKFADAISTFTEVIVNAAKENEELGKALLYVPNEEELKESEKIKTELKELIKEQKETAKKPIKPYSFQKGKK